MPRRTITTEPVATTETGHLTEFLYDDGENADLVVCAGHAGDVEPGTGELAFELTTRLTAATCWAVFGYDDAGVHPDNIVNWLAAHGGGLQLELGETPRADEAEAVLDVLESTIRVGE